MLAETVPMCLPVIETESSSCFASIEVFRNPADVVAAWTALERSSVCSVYQTQAWLRPWIDTLGRQAGLSPLFIVARQANGQVVFLACLGIFHRGPLRYATWLGGSDANFNLPLYDPEVVWTKTELLRLFRTAAAQCGSEAPHFFFLPNQPFTFHGHQNPLQQLSHWPSPSPAFGGRLATSGEAFFSNRLSKETRKKLRKKEAKLATFGTIHHVLASDASTQRRIIDTFLAQKIERFRSQGILSHFDTAEMHAFLERASAPAGSGMELHALVVGDRIEDGRIVAIYGGGVHGGQWSGMINAFDSDEEFARCSPGDLLLMRILTKACADGLTGFDLGIGTARYKLTFCDEQIDLFDATIAAGPIGAIGVRLMAARQTAKRLIKSNRRLHKFALRIASLRG